MEENEKKDEIKEAEFFSVAGGRRNYRLEIVLILIIGFLLGVMLKTESLKRVAIGFNDYKITTGKQGYDIEAIEKKLLDDNKKAMEEAKAKAEKAKANAENAKTNLEESTK